MELRFYAIGLFSLRLAKYKCSPINPEKVQELKAKIYDDIAEIKPTIDKY